MPEYDVYGQPYGGGENWPKIRQAISDYARKLGTNIIEGGRQREALMNQAFADPNNPLKITDERALAALTDKIMQGEMGITPLGITAYHGSPYLFKQFDPMKVGTGEGAQVYGVGAGYTAEARPVAEDYARNLTTQKLARDIDTDQQVRSGISLMQTTGSGGIDNLESLLQTAYGYKPDQAKNTVEKVRKAIGGYVYKGDIPDKILPKFLDWDKPIKEQSPEIKGALDEIMNTVIKKDVDMVVSRIRKDFPDFDFESINGSNVYQFVADKFQDDARKLIKKGADIEDPKLWGQQKATELFEEKGLRGIRYLDEKSRGSYKAQLTYKGQPYSDVIEFSTKRQLDNYIKENKEKGFGVQTFPQTSNFIPFSPEDFKIQEINDIPIEEWIRKGLLAP